MVPADGRCWCGRPILQPADSRSARRILAGGRRLERAGHHSESDGTFLPSDVGAGTYEAVYSFTDANGCLNRDTAVVEVIEPQIAEAGPDLSLCDIDTTFVLEGFSPVTASGWTGDPALPPMAR